jgi:WD40 repeat protein
MPFADRLDSALKAQGYEPLIDRTEIYAFEDWWKRIEALIVKADTIVFVLSPDAVASDVCTKEVAFAASLNKRFAPIVCKPVDAEAVPEPLRRLNFVFFDKDEKFDESIRGLSEALATDIEWVRKHTEFGEHARRWAAAGRPGPRGLLLRSPLLEEAEYWIASRPEGAPAPTEVAQAFIQESRKAATRRRNRLSSGLGAGLLVALALASFAYWQRGIAVEQSAAAVRQRDQALMTQSRFLADLARQRRATGDAATGILLSLEALPNAGEPRPYVPEAELQLDGNTGDLREALILAGHQDRVIDAVFSPDGTRIVTASLDRMAQLWDAQSGEPIGDSLIGHEDWVNSAAFSPDGKRIVTTSRDKTARLWDAKTGQPIGEPLRGHESSVGTAQFSPDGKSIATGSLDNTVRFWDAESGTPIGEPLGAHTGPVASVAFSPDGKRILTASWDKTARIWDVTTRQQIGEPLIGHEEWVNSATFSPDGKRIATASEDGTARLWNAGTGQPIGAPIETEGLLRSVEFSPDGKRIVTSSTDKTARQWDAETGKQIGEPLSGHLLVVFHAAFSPDGKRIVTASADGTARVWNVEHQERAGRPLEGAGGTASFSPDGTRIVAAARSPGLTFWDAETGKRVIEPFRWPSEIGVYSVAFRPDGERIVTTSDNIAQVWDSRTGKQIGASLTGHKEQVRSAMFSPDGKRIVTASDDKTAWLWDAETGQPIGKPLISHEDKVLTAAFSPDGKSIVTGSWDATVRLWDAVTAEQIGKPLRHDATVYSAAFSPDGKRIVSASGRTAQIWDVGTRSQIAILEGHKEEVLNAAFSPDGKRIVTASWDEAIRLWDAESGKPIRDPFAVNGKAHNAAFSPDGKRIVATFFQWTYGARLWRTAGTVQEYISYAQRIVPRCLTRQQREEFFLQPEPPAWCIEMEKWPYYTQDWQDWLQFKRSNANPPLPDTPEWQVWLATHK